MERLLYRRPCGALTTSVAACAFALVALVALLIAPAALAGQITPEHGGSPNANSTDDLYRFVLVIAIGIFVAVEGALIFTIVRFRKSRERASSVVTPRARLEFAWAILPIALLAAIAAVTVVKLDGIKNPPNAKIALPVRLTVQGIGAQSQSQQQPIPSPGQPVTIKVQGQRYLWRYLYPNGAFSYRVLVIPADTVVNLELTAQDVIHSWWVPKLGGKVDTVPGYVTHTWIKPLATGTYEGQCAEFCGLQHAVMYATVRVVDPKAWQLWVRRQQALIGQAQKALQKKSEKGEVNDNT